MLPRNDGETVTYRGMVLVVKMLPRIIHAKVEVKLASKAGWEGVKSDRIIDGRN